MLITRIAAVALTATGLSEESARFQSRSAFTGVGYTTNEAENVVNHPVRRRIVMALMMVGNVGIVTAVASLLMSFTGAAGPTAWLPRLTMLLAGLGTLYLATKIPAVDRAIHRFIEFLLRRFSSFHPRDYARLVSLPGDYGVTELQVQREDWLANRTLGEADLHREGLLVLGVHRADGVYEGLPQAATRIFHTIA